MAAQLLHVFLDGTFVGRLEQTGQGGISFTYDKAYQGRRHKTPLSLSLPLAVATHRNRPVRAFLEGLLPDSEAARRKWAVQYKASANNAFSLLAHVGRDAAGAVQILQPEEKPTDAGSIDFIDRDPIFTDRAESVEWLTPGDLAVMVSDLAENRGDWDPGRQGGRWSLSGAQPKVALFRDPETGSWGVPSGTTPTTHIVKPMLEGYEGHDLNETLCLRAAREVGLPASRIELLDVAGVRAVVSTRFDRRYAHGRWTRLHQEDLCQALSVAPAQKYQSDGGPGVGEIADLFATLPVSNRIPNAEAFFRALALNVLIGGTDAHAKNYSLGLRFSQVQMTPLYDVASAAPYPTHQRLDSAMKIGRSWTMLEVTSRDWASVARRLQLPEEQALAWVQDLRGRLPEAFAAAVASLPSDIHERGGRIAEPIIDHVEGRWKPSRDRDPARNLRRPRA